MGNVLRGYQSINRGRSNQEGYNYYVSRSIARLQVAGVNFVYDVKKDDFLKSWRSLSIHSDGFLATRTSRTNERQETCPSLRASEYSPNERRPPQTNEFQSIHRTNEETR